MKLKISLMTVVMIALLPITVVQGLDYSSEIEKQIRNGTTTTADQIVSDHPRMWLRDWNYTNRGSFMWRVLHGVPMDRTNPANDQEKSEFFYCACGGGGDYSAEYMINEGQVGHTTHGRRVLEHIMAGKALRNNWWDFYSGSSLTCNTAHTSDEFLAYAREKLLGILGVTDYQRTIYTIIYGPVAYDWLYNEVYSNGEPVLSQADKETIRDSLIIMADRIKSYATGSEGFFHAGDVSSYFYPMVGFALYEPSRIGDPSYASTNAKAREYLDDFDTYVVGKFLPALNEQGGDGGWHAGMTGVPSYDFLYNTNSSGMVPALIAPVLFAHYTATGESSFEDSLFSTGFLKYFVEFQNYMIRPDEGGYYPSDYYAMNNVSSNRDIWTFLFRTYSRRRFSSDPEQQRLGELGGWIRYTFSHQFHDGGSWDFLNQLLWEDKWPNPRNPVQIGFPLTRHFQNLGWVFMREGFGSADDLAALFISQRYHWSAPNPHSQNSFTLERKGELIEGFQNAIYIDDEYQREITSFPTIADGVEAYSPGSAYDVGPGILDFQSNDIYDYVKGDGTKAYDSLKLDQFTRQLVYLKPNIFVMFDKVVTDNAGTKKSWVIDPGATPIDEGNNLYLIGNGAGMLWIKNLSPQSTTVESLTASQFKISSSGTRESYFIHVMEATDSGVSSSTVSADNATVIVEGDWYHIQVAGHRVSFNKNGDFEFDGSAPATDTEDPTVTSSSSGGGGCFIATAAFGSKFEKHVQVLRQFRDIYLIPSIIGHAFVNVYYKYSPPVADFIADQGTVRTMVRWSLLPMVGLSWMLLHIGVVPTLLVLVLMSFIIFARS